MFALGLRVRPALPAFDICGGLLCSNLVLFLCAAHRLPRVDAQAPPPREQQHHQQHHRPQTRINHGWQGPLPTHLGEAQRGVEAAFARLFARGGPVDALQLREVQRAAHGAEPGRAVQGQEAGGIHLAEPQVSPADVVHRPRHLVLVHPRHQHRRQVRQGLQAQGQNGAAGLRLGDPTQPGCRRRSHPQNRLRNNRQMHRPTVVGPAADQRQEAALLVLPV